ncbi:hypothetical protein [Haladaptatus sp. DFWS20]|uniref:hypothetical protein n=1 Tax=Haladaptatus sp. DFWS20 TaxID=3403467 RepID=UPI003EBD190C
MESNHRGHFVAAIDDTSRSVDGASTNKQPVLVPGNPGKLMAVPGRGTTIFVCMTLATASVQAFRDA